MVFQYAPERFVWGRFSFFIFLIAIVTTLRSTPARAFVAPSLLSPLTPPTLKKVSFTRKSPRVYDDVWGRMRFKDDEEPGWYLINTSPGAEMDLMNQCYEVTKGMEGVVKFVVPTEQKTRSHGSKKMMKENKIRFSGFVFAKLQMTKEIYEAINSLGLARNWMGTIHRKGYLKRPTVPTQLNEEEIEEFGLEELETNDDSLSVMSFDVEQDSNSLTSLIDNDDGLKIYDGLRVDDMVKIIKKGGKFNEDAIVKRLKDGKVKIQTYTYGRMYEDWVDPGDLRKLTKLEVLIGLSAKSPVTGKDFGGQGGRGNRGDRFDDDRGYDSRNQVGSLGGSFSGGGRGMRQTRNRRQDRNERRERGGDFFGRTDAEARQEEDNWNRFQRGGRDGSYDSSRRRDRERPRSRNRRQPWDDDFVQEEEYTRETLSEDDDEMFSLSDVDSQWGRRHRPASRNQRTPAGDRRGTGRNYGRTRDDRQGSFDRSAGGDRDWTNKQSTPDDSEVDDFFESLMSEIQNDVKDDGRGGGRGSRRGSFQDSRTDNRSSPSSRKESDDDFFESLMSELSEETASGSSESAGRREGSNQRLQASNKGDDDDFFASLEAELGSDSDTTVSRSSPAEVPDETDDFFRRLEEEIVPDSSPQNAKKQEWGSEYIAPAAGASKDDGDVMASNDSGKTTEMDSADDFFASLDLDSLAAETTGDVETSQITSEETTPVSKGGSKSKQKKPPQEKLVPVPGSSDLSKHTVPVLKSMLKERGLKVSGKKAELIERLMQS